MKKSRQHQAALRYAERGIPIFPCIPWAEDDPSLPPGKRGKRPYGPFAPEGFKNSTTDPDLINQWWTAKPDLNIAASPHAAGCCVVDIDAPEALALLELDHGQLPATFTVQTPSGGLHLWYKGELPSSGSKLAPKVDTRGKGSYVLLPPSFINGNHYKVIDKTPPVQVPASIPAFLEALASKSKATGISAPEHKIDLPAAIQRGRDMAKMWPVAEWGTIDDTTYKHCAALADIGLSKDAIYDIIKEWYDRTGTKGDLERLHTVAGSGLKNRENEEGVWAVQDANELFKNFSGQVFVKPDLVSKFKPLSESEMERLPPPTWLLPNVLPDNQLVMLYAPSKGWKTFLALDWAMTIASGIDKWGAIDAGAVVYIAAEGATGLGKSRRPAWRLLHGIERPVPFHIVNAMPHLGSPEQVLEMCEQVKAVGPIKLLIVDTLARFMAGLDESGSRDAGMAIEALEMIKRELGCTVLCLHHTGKDASRGERGSSALRAGFDSGFELVADKDSSTAQVWARWHKDAETPAIPWQLKAERVLESLVFRFAEAEDLPVKERMTPADIGFVLRTMGVIGQDAAVPTAVLVTGLAAMKQWPEKKAAAMLKMLSKSGKLTGYEVAPNGPYYLPEPMIAADSEASF